jgi:predicted acylesterase/phospholipase RssA
MIHPIIVALWCVNLSRPIIELRDKFGYDAVKDTTHLVLSGGSVKGLAHLGCLYEIMRIEPNFFHNITKISFTSAGCLAALCCAFKFMGFKEWILKYDVESIMSKPDVDTLFGRVMGWFEIGKNRFGKKRNNDFFADNGTGLRTFIRTLIRRVSGLEKPTLLELHTRIFELTGRTTVLCVYAANIDHRKCDALSFNTHPEVLAEDAFMAAAAVPFLFPPVIIRGITYVDGGTIMNIPTPKTKNQHDILYLKLRHSQNYCNNFKENAAEYAYRLLEIIFDGQLESLYHFYPELGNRLITIDCDAGGLSEFAKNGIGNVNMLYESGSHAFHAYCLSSILVTSSKLFCSTAIKRRIITKI